MKWSPLMQLLQFSPTADPTTQGTLLDVTNLIPSERGWRTAYSLANTGMNTLTATCVGAAIVQKLDGDHLMFAGSDRLYVRSAQTWVDISESATAYSATPDQRWRFASMGDYVLAASESETVQASNAGGTFSAITGAPLAAVIESVGGFIMAADVTHGTYSGDDRWWCSAIFDHTDWTPALATQCTTGRLVDTPGPIRGLRRLGGAVVAYKDRSMYLGQYVQPPTVWQWTLVSSNVGCASHEAVVNIGTGHLFIGEDNIYVFDGAQVTPIGEPVREWFYDQELLKTYASRIQASHDAAKGIVYWHYPPTSGSGALTAALVYNYKQNRWGHADYSVEAAADYVAAGITYDGLGTYYSTYDAGIDRTYDSPLWVPTSIRPSVFDTSHVLRTIDGASTASQFQTWHIGDDQQMTLLRRVRVRWLTAPSTAIMALHTTDQHGDALVLRETTEQTDNKFDALSAARWHRLTFDLTGDAEFAGLQVDVEPQGMW